MLCLQTRFPNACARLCLRGLSADNGGLSQYSVIAEHSVHVLPENVPLDIGAMVQPMSISWHAVRISGFKEGDTALVIGAGPIGIAAILALQGHGASQIIVSEPASIRRDQAIALGAQHALDPTSFASIEDNVARIRELTPPDYEGVDYVFDCGGVQATVDLGFGVLKMGGTVVNLAVWPQDKTATFKPMAVTNREKRYMGSMGLTALDMDQVLEAFATGKMSMDKARTMITSKIHLEEAIDKGSISCSTTRISTLRSLLRLMVTWMAFHQMRPNSIFLEVSMSFPGKSNLKLIKFLYFLLWYFENIIISSVIFLGV